MSLKYRSILVAQPLVSVLMAVFNEEKYLPYSIESILNQTYKSFELIIINDGSTDSTKDVLNKYQNDPRIKIITQRNIGLARSLNKGIDISVGKYIARQDGDDISEPRRLEKQVEFMEKNADIGFIGSNYHVINENNQITDTTNVFTKPEDIMLAEITSNQFGHGSILIRRKEIKKYKYDPGFRVAQDYDLWSKLLHSTKAANMITPLYRWRSIGTGQSTKPENKALLTNTEKIIRDREFDYYLKNRDKYKLLFLSPYSVRKGAFSYFRMKNTLLRNMSLMYTERGMRRVAVPLLAYAVLFRPVHIKTYKQLFYTLVNTNKLLSTFNKEYI